MAVKVLRYVVVCAFVFAMLDWQIVKLTRFTHPEWKDWMHGHETQYALTVHTLETVLCPPAVALKPLFYFAALSVEASKEQQAAINHAPGPDWSGFYKLMKRGDSWTFVSWFWWFLYWTPVTVIWWRFAKRFFE